MRSYKNYLLLALVGAVLAGCVVHERRAGYDYGWRHGHKPAWGWADRGHHRDHGHHDRHWRRW